MIGEINSTTNQVLLGHDGAVMDMGVHFADVVEITMRNLLLGS